MQCCETLLFILCLGLPTGILVAAQTDQQCSLEFYFRTDSRDTQFDRVVFTGLTAEEVTASGNTTIGHRLTCACPTMEGLKPRLWRGLNGRVLPRGNRRELVDYKVARKQPGSAVHLRIHRRDFSCTDAGTYTCVIGINNRTVLVTPVGRDCGPANVAITASLTGPISSGADLTLHCSADDPTESGLTYEWLHGGDQVGGEFSPNLTLSMAGPEEGGTYTCHVSNRVGQRNATVTVDVVDTSTTLTEMTSIRTPEEMTAIPVKLSSLLEKVTSTPVQMTNTPEEVTSTSVEMTSAPEGVASTPVEMTSTPEEVASTPVVMTSTPEEVASTPVEVTSILVEVTSKPVQIASTTEEMINPVQVTSAPQELTSIPVEITSTPEMTTSPMEMTGTPDEVEEVTSIPVQATSTPEVEVMISASEKITIPMEVTGTPKVTGIPLQTSTPEEVTGAPEEVTTAPKDAPSIQVMTLRSSAMGVSTLVEPSIIPILPSFTQVKAKSPSVNPTFVPPSSKVVTSPITTIVPTHTQSTESLSAEHTPSPTPSISTTTEVSSMPLEVTNVPSTPLMLMPSVEGYPGWKIAVIIIACLIVICFIVVIVILWCLVCYMARRTGKYALSAAEKTHKVNYVYDMDGQPDPGLHAVATV